MTPAHWVYLLAVVVLLALMMFRKNLAIPAIAATFVTVLVYTHSVPLAVASMFNAIYEAGVELFTIFVVVAIVRALFNSLKEIGADRAMAAPFVRFMRGQTGAFWTLAAAMWAFSLMFWPTPALAIVGAVLVPVALRVGMSPVTAAAVIGIAGSGMAASDYILRAGPGISSSASGAPVEMIADRAFVVALIAGMIALSILFVQHLRERRTLPSAAAGPEQVTEEGDFAAGFKGLPKKAIIMAALVATVFLVLVIYMLLPLVFENAPESKGMGTGLVASIALILIVPSTIVSSRNDWLERSAEHLLGGLVFAFKAMGIVIPIAGFFFLGISSFSEAITGVEGAPGFLIDSIAVVASHVPTDGVVAPIMVAIVGLVAGLDGSGFANLPLTGSLSQGLAGGSVEHASTLAAVGQVSTLWSGGGALVPWSSLVAVAAIVGANVLDVARKALVPSLIGLLIASSLTVLIF